MGAGTSTTVLCCIYLVEPMEVCMYLARVWDCDRLNQRCSMLIAKFTILLFLASSSLQTPFFPLTHHYPRVCARHLDSLYLLISWAITPRTTLLQPDSVLSDPLSFHLSFTLFPRPGLHILWSLSFSEIHLDFYIISLNSGWHFKFFVCSKSPNYVSRLVGSDNGNL